MTRPGGGILALLVALGLTTTHSALAMPSSTNWTPCTMDFQTPGLTHITLDNYFTVGRRGPGNGGESFPTDFPIRADYSHLLQHRRSFHARLRQAV